MKPTTDFVLTRHAHAPRVGTIETDVGDGTGPVKKVARVLGDRFWVKGVGKLGMTDPHPFKQIPLVYGNAFDG